MYFVGSSSQEGEEKYVETGEGGDQVQLPDCRDGCRRQIVFIQILFYTNLVNKKPFRKG